MPVYTIHKDFSKEENPYSVWRDDGELIEDDLSYGEVSSLYRYTHTCVRKKGGVPTVPVSP